MTEQTEQQYNAAEIEVLTGLDPVRRRPGMYTDTSRPNHLVQEVVDNSVDEAVAGYASEISVTLHTDGAITVSDDGRGMPVDPHPELKRPGVEVILSTLHAGGKFSQKSYQFSGGLHGVGVSVVNGLSAELEVWVRRGGREYYMAFADGERACELTVVAHKLPKRETGTTLRFLPNPVYFDTPKFSLPRLKYILRAKAVLCPGLKVTCHDEAGETTDVWQYADGLADYLLEAVAGRECLPQTPFVGHFQGKDSAVDWAVVWLPERDEAVQESYVNLIPTVQGGTHVNGLRSGLIEALRGFCEFRNLLPKGVKLAPDDLWEGIAYVLSVKLAEPQFSGQTKERLSSRDAAAFVGGVVADEFGHWLNQHPETGDQLAQLVIENAQKRLRASKQVTRKKVASGPALPGKLADCASQDSRYTELFLVEGDSAGGSTKQARDREFQAVLPLRGKILNSWEVEPSQVLSSQEIHDIAVAAGVEPGADDLSGLRYNKFCILADADSDGLHIATLLCALFLKHFRPLVAGGHVYVAMPPLYRIDIGKDVFYALDEDERNGILQRLEAEQRKGKVAVTRFKGLGEMSPLQLRETTMAPDTRRLVQLVVDDEAGTDALMDMLLAKKRAADRRAWLEEKGDRAEVQY